MGVQKEVIKEGNGKDYPRPGDQVTIEYTGNLYAEAAGKHNHYRGEQYVRWRLHSPQAPLERDPAHQYLLMS